jgi:uncharacterized protein
MCRLASADFRPPLKESTMKRLTTFIACASFLPAAAFAAEPTFDCAKAQGEVEKLICGEAALAAPDPNLGEV